MVDEQLRRESGLLLNYGNTERKVLVIYTGGTIGMVNNTDGCKLRLYKYLLIIIL